MSLNRKKILAANWKMNLNLQDAINLYGEFLNGCKHDNVLKIVFPSSLFISSLHHEYSNSFILLGAQNCSEHMKGAFTGEISAGMIKSAGASYCLVGHSERRTYFQETATQLQSKISRCLENGLNVIFCVGEQLKERQEGSHFDTIRFQLNAVLEDINTTHFSNIVLAYEPVWAIGTGHTASPQQAQEMHQFIRQHISTLKGNKIAENISILYGGSCNPENAPELFSCADVDGGLIGGASLYARDFIAIANSF